MAVKRIKVLSNNSEVPMNPAQKIYPSHDVLRVKRRDLSSFFSPKSVALIGASDEIGSVGRILMENLLNDTFQGTVYPVNPKHETVLGQRSYPKIISVPESVDLAIIATPASLVPSVVQECADVGVKSVVIISAGFKEVGAEGNALEEEILRIARSNGMRIIGPNCLGVMYPKSGLNATFATSMAKPGNIAFISQSGAMCTAILDWSLQNNVGFSSFVSVGSMLDVNWGDLLLYLGNDPYTKSIIIYMESIGNARTFLSAAREVALSKPIIVIKAGRTDAAAQAAASHTGTLTGSDDVLHAAFKRCGVMRVDSISDLFDMADILAKQPRPKGNRLSIITNAGGPGVLATDALTSHGGELAKLSESSLAELDAVLPEHWSHSNPIDILGDAQPETYKKTLEIVSADPNSDGLLVILSPQSMTDPTKTADYLKHYAKKTGKPILASWMGGLNVAAGKMALSQSGIPVFEYPDTAARLFNYLWKYNRRLSSLYETPRFALDTDQTTAEKQHVSTLIDQAMGEKRSLMTEYEAKQILAAYSIPTVQTWIAQTEVEAIQLAEHIGYPVVLKLNSNTVTHKTDVGGVKLNLRDEDAVRYAYRQIKGAVPPADFEGVSVQQMIANNGYEVILGSSIDPQFGPILLFGTGGTMVEVYKDHALGLPPLNTTQARRMMESTKIYQAFKGIRGRAPIDFEALEQLLVRFSQLVIEQPRIKEIDINPLIVSEDRLLVLDARIVLHPADVPNSALPHPAIRPYPTQYVQQWVAHNALPLTIRPIMPEDEPLVATFHERISQESVYMRYFQALNLSQRVRHERLIRICHVDYAREMALVMEAEKDGQPELVAIGRLSALNDGESAEFSMLIQDNMQRTGIGTKMLQELVRIAKLEGFKRVVADILPDNKGMQRVCEKLGFTLQLNTYDQVVKATIEV